MCLETAISGPRLIRAWKRRSWIEYCFRTLKHLLATGTCQLHREAAYYGHLVLRLMGCLVLPYTSRVICKGRLTMEEIIFSLKHYWRFVDSEPLDLKALSQGGTRKPHEHKPNSESGKVTISSCCYLWEEYPPPFQAGGRPHRPSRGPNHGERNPRGAAATR